MNTALYLHRALQAGLRISDLERLSVGMVISILIEAGNDGADYDYLPTQDDFDAF
jgi:hypothetical protein